MGMTQSHETPPTDLTVEQVKELVDRGEVALQVGHARRVLDLAVVVVREDVAGDPRLVAYCAVSEALGVDHFMMRCHWPGLEFEKALGSIKRLGKIFA